MATSKEFRTPGTFSKIFFVGQGQVAHGVAIPPLWH